MEVHAAQCSPFGGCPVHSQLQHGWPMGACHLFASAILGMTNGDPPALQVTALLRHDRDLVKKKALLAMQRFLQVRRPGPEGR